MTPGARSLLVALALVASGCPGSGDNRPPSGPPPTPPATPTGLTLTPTAIWGRYTVTWVAPAGVIQGYELEGRADAAPFERTHAGLLSAASTSNVVDAWTEPELARLELRIRAVAGALVSGWSEVASIRQALRAPDQLTAAPTMSADGSATPPIEVGWILPAGTVAADLVLERAEVTGSDPAWLPIPGVAASQVSYADADVEDGRSYLYRLHRTADGLESPAAVSSPTWPLSVLAPLGPSVALVGQGAEPAGFRVSWTNLSASADTMRVERLTPWFPVPEEVGTVGIAGPYDDLTWPQWPGASYRIQALRTGSAASVASPWIAAPGFRRSGALNLDGSTMEVPSGEGFAQDAAGQVHVLRTQAFDGAVPSVLRPTGAGWDMRALEGEIGFFVSPGLTLDPEGHPHVAYVVAHPFDSATYTVRHFWYDGAAWQTADLTLQASETATAFAAGPGGAAHLVYTRPSPSTTTLVHAAWQEGGWVQTVLPAVGFYSEPKALHAAADGSLLLGVPALNGTGYAVAVRPPGGAWSIEQVPGLAPFGGTSAAWFAAGEGGVAAVVVQRTTQLDLYWEAHRDASGAWTAPALLASGPFIGMVNQASLATAGDGSRTIFVVRLADDAGASHHELLVRGATGGWRRMRLGPPGVQPSPTFSPDGKARILGLVARPGAAPLTLPLLAEP